MCFIIDEITNRSVTTDVVRPVTSGIVVHLSNKSTTVSGMINIYV